MPLGHNFVPAFEPLPSSCEPQRESHARASRLKAHIAALRKQLQSRRSADFHAGRAILVAGLPHADRQQNSCASSWPLLQTGNQEVAYMTDRIEKTVELEAPVSRVWRALTDHVEFGTWFRVRLEGPFVPGQVSRGHITYPGYEHLRWEAVVQKMEPERLFSFTWHPYA